MFNRILTLSLAAGLLMSCSKKDDETKTEAPKNTKSTDTEPAVAAVAKQPAAAVLVLKAATLSVDKGANNPDGLESIELDDEGNVIFEGETVVKLAADGTVTDTAGTVIARIAADGKVTFVGEDRTMIIAEDGTMTAKGDAISTIKIEIDGVRHTIAVSSIGDSGVESSPGPGEKLVFEGPKEARRAMMLAFMIGIMPRKTQPTVQAPANGELTDLKAGDKGCNMTFEGRCFKTDIDACKAGGCELADCDIAESMPGQASCREK